MFNPEFNSECNIGIEFREEVREMPRLINMGMAVTYLVMGWVCFLDCPAWTDPVASDDVRAVVRGWLNTGTRPLGTPMGGEIDRLVSYPDEAGQVAWHVVYLRPSGFVIVPADDWLEPILAFAPRGLFDPGDCDGDRRADPGVFNPSAGSWVVWLSASGYAGVGPVFF